MVYARYTARMARHRETHLSGRAGWLRAAVLGSNDAIVSTASLMIGIAAAEASTSVILTAGIAGLCAGSMSMAAGEYVSVSSQRDSEEADIARETRELATSPESELEELTGIYVARGLDPKLAREVATRLTAHDKLGTHLRDELGIQQHALARPFQAAWISALSFAVFALLPILGLLIAPVSLRIVSIASITLLSLAALGGLGGRLGGASIVRASLRVTLGGAIAMAITAGIGRLLGVAAG